jgi:hypothetical protein
MAEVAVPGILIARILRLMAEPGWRPHPSPAWAGPAELCTTEEATGEVFLDRVQLGDDEQSTRHFSSRTMLS